MKKIFIILIAILSIGLAFAGGIGIVREIIADITAEDKVELLSKNITDIDLTELIDKGNYYVFWITKEGAVNKQETIYKYKEVCTNSTRSYTIDVCPEPNETIQIINKIEVSVKENVSCYQVTTQSPITNCEWVLKSDAELQTERDNKRQEILKLLSTPKPIKTNVTKLEPEKVIIDQRAYDDSKRVIEEVIG